MAFCFAHLVKLTAIRGQTNARSMSRNRELNQSLQVAFVDFFLGCEWCWNDRHNPVNLDSLAHNLARTLRSLYRVGSNTIFPFNTVCVIFSPASVPRNNTRFAALPTARPYVFSP